MTYVPYVFFILAFLSFVFSFITNMKINKNINWTIHNHDKSAMLSGSITEQIDNLENTKVSLFKTPLVLIAIAVAIKYVLV